MCGKRQSFKTFFLVKDASAATPDSLPPARRGRCADCPEPRTRTQEVSERRCASVALSALKPCCRAPRDTAGRTYREAEVLLFRGRSHPGGADQPGMSGCSPSRWPITGTDRIHVARSHEVGLHPSDDLSPSVAPANAGQRQNAAGADGGIGKCCSLIPLDLIVGIATVSQTAQFDRFEELQSPPLSRFFEVFSKKARIRNAGVTGSSPVGGTILTQSRW